MIPFYEFIQSLDALNDNEKTEIMGCYDLAVEATKPKEIRDALTKAVSIIQYTPEPNPVLFSRVKNLHELPYSPLDARRGIHVVRSVFANEVHLMRAKKIENKSNGLNTYLNDGLVVINDFLGEELAERIGRITEKFPVSVNKQPFNLVNRMNNEPEIRDLILNGKMRDVVFECLMLSKNHSDASRQYLNNTFVQRVHNKPDDGDVQKVMHIDTYYDAMKFWYFPKVVRLENGPFTISPNSHIMGTKRLMWMQAAYMRYYEDTVGAERAKDHSEGSLRILADEMEKLGYESRPMIVPKDSIIISNVFGLHGRGNATVESIRDSIHGSIRLDSPFDDEE